MSITKRIEKLEAAAPSPEGEYEISWEEFVRRLNAGESIDGTNWADWMAEQELTE